jgi:hypothetical protein
MKTLLTAICLGGALTAYAAPGQCPSTTTLDQLIALTSIGCQSQDKIFNNFNYSGSDASSVLATLVTAPGGMNQDIHGWSFTRVGGPWTSSFTIGFTVAIAPGNSGVTIVASKDQIDSGPTPNGTTVTDTQTAATLTVNGSSAASETQQAGYAGVTATTTSSAVTLTGGDLLITYDQVFFEQGGAPRDALLLNYAANLLIGDSTVNITNAGTRNGFDPAGGLCANVYVFDPSEELIACCACYVTPDGLRSLSAKQDLVSNTLTPGVPGSVVIKILASAPVTPSNCNPSTPTAGNLEPGLRAWRTTIHQSTTSGTYQLTENVFQSATISDSELMKLTTYCGFIQSNGSTFGICKSCRFGGLGGANK